ncbi:MAG: hypothetical protein RL518_2356 [Pseudomonadota bacterium]|jgi:hypothetical protein
MRSSLLKTVLLASMAASAMVGCGGGGGDDSSDFSGAANVSMSLNPSSLDSGDRTLVRVEVSDVHENGIALKFRYPEGLVYVSNSGTLVIDEKETSIKPRVNAVTSDEESVYLVFYLPQKLFRRAGQEYSGEGGTVELQLVGKSAVQDGLVEVDADVDDPGIADTLEFNISKPEFLAEDQQSISVQVAE